MRVLIVEDETRLAALLRQALEEEAYAADVVGDGNAALDWLSAAAYDLVILDVMLPHKSGIEVCKAYRAKGGRAAILMLTARDTLSDRVLGLDSGADDYLVKPFGMPELLARLRALARRDGPSKTNELRLHDLVLNTATKYAERAGQRIKLTAVEYALLEFLMRHARQVVTRDQIIEHVWNADFDAGSKLVEVYIYHLRRKIDEGQAVKLIQTMRGIGYRMSNDDA
jgi:two-component system, OmpR family, copper resistance phosphate regulon response regulator CusR